MKPSRRVAAVLAFLAAGVLGLLAVGWFPQGPLRRMLESRLQQLIGPDSRVGSLRVVPGRLSAEIRGLVLDSPTYRLQADRVRVRLSRETLFRPGLFVDHLEMQGGLILLRTPAEPPAPSPPPSDPIVVRDIVIEGATVRYEDPGLGGPVVLQQVDLHGGLGDGVLEGTARGGVWQRTDPVALGPVRARLRISPRLDLHVESLDAGLARTRVHLAGSLGRVGALRLDLRFDVRADLDEVQALARIAPASGTITGKGRVTGPTDALLVEADLQGEGLQAAGWPLERLAAQVRHDAGATATSARIHLMGGQGQLEVLLRGSAAEGRLILAGVDLARLQRQMSRAAATVAGVGSATIRFEGDLNRRVQVEARLEGDGRTAEGLRFQAQARANGTVQLPEKHLDLGWTLALTTERPASRLTATGTAGGPLPPTVVGRVGGTLSVPSPQGPVPITVEGDVRSQGNQVAADVRLAALGGEAQGSLQVQGSRVRALDLEGRSLDLARLVEGAQGQAGFRFRASGPVDALSGAGQVRVDSLAWRDLDLGTLKVDVDATRGIATLRAELPRFHATSVSRLVPGPRRGAGATLRGTVALAEAPLGLLAPLMPPGRPLDGTLSGTAEFDLPLSAPSAATLRARVELLDLQSDRLAARTTQPFSIGFDRGRVAVDGLHLSGEGFSVEAQGTAGLKPADALDLRVIAETDLAALPVPALWQAQGSMRAELAATGTRASPRANGFARLEQVLVESPTLPPVRIASGRLDLDGEAVTVPGLTAEMADGAVEVRGRVPLAAFWPEARRHQGPPSSEEEAALTIAWTGIQAGQILSRLRPGQAATLDATLAGQAEVRGGLASLAELRATVGLPATNARVQDLDIALKRAEIHVEKGRVSTAGVEVNAAGGSLALAGGIDLVSRALDVSGHGTLELRALSPFLKEAALTGTSEVDLRVGGSLDAPSAEGSMRVRDGTIRLRTLPQPVTGLAADLTFDGTTVRLQSATARFGGGPLNASGTARLDKTGLVDAHFILTGRDLAVRYPEGMRTRLEADLTLTGRTGAFQLAGTVRALRGLYELDAALDESLTAPAPAAEPSPLLRSVGLDIQVVTESPILVRNNMARLQATGRLTVRGDMETPAPIGRLEIQPGGKVFLQGREFAVGSGRLAYTGTWDPELALEASARLSDIDSQTGLSRGPRNVTVGLTGRLMSPSASLRSEPAYSRLEIVNLIATGDSQNPSARLALGGQGAALLAGRVTSKIRRLGFDEVSIQPELVANEDGVETGARFTFGKRLSSRVNLVYSLSLQDPEARFIEVEGTPGWSSTTSVRRTDEGSFTYGAGQRFRFGGGALRVETAEQRVRVAEVRLEGDRPLEPEELRAAIRTDPGDRRTVWDLQDDTDRLRERLVERGYLEAEVGARFDGQVAVFTVRSGDRYRWKVEGMVDPPDLTHVIASSLFEEEALEKGRERLLEALHERGHLRAVVEARMVPTEAGRELLFEVRTGPVLQADVSFPGARTLSPSRLLRAAGGAGRLLSAPGAAVADMHAAYRAAYYLAAEVEAPRIEEGVREGGRLRVIVAVREGPRARVAAVRFEGATVSEADLARMAALEPGAEYDADQTLAATDRIRAHYFGLGYAAVRVTPRVDTHDGDVNVVFQVVEGERVTVASVVLQGLRRARQSLVRGEVKLRPGDPLDPRKVAEMERRLLDLGLFTRAAATVSDGNPATITVLLEEGDRLRTGYLLSYNDDKGSRGELDGELRGILGAGLSIGGRVSLGPDLRDARAYLNIPSLLPTGRLTLSVFRLAEDLPLIPGEPNGETFERVQVGGQIQATRPLAGRWNLLYGYRLKRSTVISPFLTSTRRVAGLDVSLLRDSRDNTLDARRGRFLSLSLEVAPKALGSDFDFVKGFAQAFASRPLTDSWTWAHGYRLGLAHAFGGEPLVSDEGFEAGGGNSIRGFDSGEVGPAGYRFGRQAALILNQELRYHHPSGLGGVVFYDAGNTFRTVREMSLSLRHVLGAGLRWNSPVGLLRLDLGRALDRREGEPAYKVFFSFGQAF